MQWKIIPGFSRYEVSEIGEVRSRVAYGRWVAGPRSSHAHKQYKRIRILSDIGTSKRMFVHRLVALAFLDPPPSPDHVEIAHINGLGRCNHFTNLRWSTKAGNCDDKRRHGTMPIGEKHVRPGAKLSEEQVLDIYSTTDPARILAERHRISKSTVHGIRNGRFWSHITGHAA